MHLFFLSFKWTRMKDNKNYLPSLICCDVRIFDYYFYYFFVLPLITIYSLCLSFLSNISNWYKLNHVQLESGAYSISFTRGKCKLVHLLNICQTFVLSEWANLRCWLEKYLLINKKSEFSNSLVHQLYFTPFYLIVYFINTRRPQWSSRLVCLFLLLFRFYAHTSRCIDILYTLITCVLER